MSAPPRSTLKLLSPVTLGRLSLANRVVMAPLTRSRAGADGVPGASALLYYAQRAAAGLIVTEGTCISPVAVGAPWIPGIWTAEQMQAWGAITDAVHAQGGTIVLQLWHTGRASHPSVQPGNGKPVGPSPVTIRGEAFTAEGMAPFEEPRALSAGEITGIVEEYARGAKNALSVGFDGVEIHGANGYLVDQFLHSSANRREDEWGGSIANRSRFLFAVCEAVSNAVGADRVGLRLSPSSSFNDMSDPESEALYTFVLDGLRTSDLAYLHIVEPGVSGAETAEEGPVHLDSSWVRSRWEGGLIAAGNYTRASGEDALLREDADAVAYGRAFLANPDLPERFAHDSPLNEPDRLTFYGGDDRGYLDYPSLEAERQLAELQAAQDVAPDMPGLSATTPIDAWARAWACSRITESSAVR